MTGFFEKYIVRGRRPVQQLRPQKIMGAPASSKQLSGFGFMTVRGPL
jgi:hypothetical protein